LRRVKEGVMRALPHKVERTVLCPLSRMQVTVTVTGGASSTRIPLPHPLPSPPSLPLCNPSRRPQTFLYNNFRKAAARYAEGGGNDAADDETDDDAGVGAGAGAVARRGVGKLSYANCLMQLRKLCNHPYLLLEDVRTIPDALYHRYLVAARSVRECSGLPPALPRPVVSHAQMPLLLSSCHRKWQALHAGRAAAKPAAGRTQGAAPSPSRPLRCPLHSSHPTLSLPLPLRRRCSSSAR